MSASFLSAAANRTTDTSATTNSDVKPADSNVDTITDGLAAVDVSDGAAAAPPVPPPPPAHPSLERFSSLIRDAPPQSIIVMVGAGASVSAGIPDFRTPGTGLYSNLQKYNLPYAEAVFDIQYFRHNPAPFYTLVKEMWPGTYEPTVAHKFFTALHKEGKLLRCFTQNIDSLESLAGLPEEMIVAAHGNFDGAHVVTDDELSWGEDSVSAERRKKVPIDEVKEAVMEGESGWRRMNAKYKGLVKPAITFFGENLPKRFLQCVRSDFPQCKLLLIFGTSLMVQPFASLVKFAPKGTPRMLVNRERRGQDLGLDFDSEDSTDGLFLGDCDAGAKGLAAWLGWDLGITSKVAVAASSSSSAAGPSKLRVGLCRSSTSKQADSVVLVAPTYADIVRAAANKLKLSRKAIKRLVLMVSVNGYPVGFPLPSGKDDLTKYLKNDVLIWVSTTGFTLPVHPVHLEEDPVHLEEEAAVNEKKDGPAAEAVVVKEEAAAIDNTRAIQAAMMRVREARLAVHR